MLTMMALALSKRQRHFLIHLCVYVDASRQDEARDALIGFDMRGTLLFVVHIVIEDEAIRIISARASTVKERQYYDQ